MSQEKKKSVADHIRHILTRIVNLEEQVQPMAGFEAKLQSLEDQSQDLVDQIQKLEARAASLSTSASYPAPPQDSEFDPLAALAPDPMPSAPPVDQDVIAQVVELESRLRQIETENQELARTCSLLQEQNEAISNLYVAKHRLHASLDSNEIMNIVNEILVELVGAEEFAILFVEQKNNQLKRVSGRGATFVADTIPLGEGLLGNIANSGQPFYYEREPGETPPDSVPIAVIPLKAEGATVGIIAVYRLLPHKDDLTPVDHQLLELVAEHTPTALLSARLHRLSKTKAKKGA